eukprot:7815016-Alexandrium_andersonii.AAC.1
MSASLVGSEMCIRDRQCPRVLVARIFASAGPVPAHVETGGARSGMAACLAVERNVPLLRYALGRRCLAALPGVP